MTNSNRGKGSPIDPALKHRAEVERLLQGRIRDLALGSELTRLYDRFAWRSRSMAVQAWLKAGIAINLLTCGMDYIMDPKLLVLSLIMRAGALTPIYAALFYCWGRPRSGWIEGGTLVAASASIMTISGILGLASNAMILECYILLAILAGATGIIIFPIRQIWTAATSTTMVLIYMIFALMNPDLTPAAAVSMGLFFTVVLSSMVFSRKMMTIVSQHSFLLTLHSQYQSIALARANERLNILVNTDSLTGVGNRRAFEAGAQTLWDGQAATGGCVGVILMDIDHFKKLNDAAGHSEGDRCLVRVAQAIQTSTVDAQAILARHGGEEFICAVPCATLQDVWRIAERIRTTIEALHLLNPGLGANQGVTISLGCALTTADEADTPEWRLQKLVERADQALYDAKARGRNRVVARLATTSADCAA